MASRYHSSASGNHSICERYRKLVDCYLDGELAPEQIVEAEMHYESCTACSSLLETEEVRRTATRQSVYQNVLPADLVDRISAMMLAQSSEQADELDEAENTLVPLSVGAATGTGTALSVSAVSTASIEGLSSDELEPLSNISQLKEGNRRPQMVTALLHLATLAAGVLVGVQLQKLEWSQYLFGSSPSDSTPLAGGANGAVEASQEGQVFSSQMLDHQTPLNGAMMVGNSQLSSAEITAQRDADAAREISAQRRQDEEDSDEILDRLVDYHSSPPSVQITQPERVRELERDVGVKVAVPKLAGARWSGGTVVPVRNSRAAYLRYTIDGEHELTLYVYNTGRMHMPIRLPQQRIDEAAPPDQRRVYVGRHRGYTVAASENGGIGYLVMTDMKPEYSAELVRTIDQ